VAKGNGYGLGLARLARKAAWLGVDTVAVGTYDEVTEVASRFQGTVMVLSPWRPFETRAVFDRHVVHTVGRLDDLHTLLGRDDRPRVVLERMTSMRRHGFSAAGLREAGQLVKDAHEGVAVEGVALHLPINTGTQMPEVERLMTDVVAADLATNRVYVSHLTDDDLDRLRVAYPEYDVRPRIGTRLWLGDPGALRVRAEVLDAHRVRRGETFGYRGRAAPRAGTVLVVSGGTAHGIGMEAPTGGATMRDRAIRLAQGGMDAAGLVRSPYIIDGKHRLFAEPPHMQASMLFLPEGTPVPAVGDEVDVRMRLTTASFDETVVS
jgi:alanine racemase